MNNKLAIFEGRPILKKPYEEPNNIGKREIEKALKVLKTGKLSCFVANNTSEFLGGPAVRLIEKRFNEYFGTNFAISVNTATSGLFSSVYALGISPGDEVIVTPYTMSATATAILACSAVPVFVDIDENDFCMDTSKIEDSITDKTKAIMVVHLFGNAVDMDEVISIAKKYNLRVIEDCAQSPGAMYKGKYVGTFGDVGIFSLNRHKTIQTGEGGVIVTNDEEIALRLQLIRNHAEVVIDQMGSSDRFNFIGWNYRMTELEAAIGAVQITKLDSLNDIRISNAEYLSEKLKYFSWIIPNSSKPDTKPVYYKFPFRYLKDNLGIKRSTLAKIMKAEGFPLQEGYVKPIYLQSIYQIESTNSPYLSQLQNCGRSYMKGICPVAERLYDEEFLFSNITHVAQNKQDIDLFIQALRKVESNIHSIGIYNIEQEI